MLCPEAVVARLQGLPDKARRTLTMDNGTENAGHEKITMEIGIKCSLLIPMLPGSEEPTKILMAWLDGICQREQISVISHVGK